MKHFDVIIIGGGMVGAGLACALQELSVSVALIDARIPSSNDPRLFALNTHSCHFLKNIGVWSACSPYATAIKQVHVSKAGQFGVVRLKASEVELSALGQVLPAYYIERAINNKLATLPNVTILRPAQLKTIVQEKDFAQLTITIDGVEQMLSSSCVLAADGTDSTVRTQVGIPTKIVEYEQSAIVFRTTLQRPHQHIAYERFIGEGAIAMLPLINPSENEYEYATIWSTTNKIVKALLSLSEKDFLLALQEAFGYRLGRFQHTSQRYCYPLRMVEAQENFIGSVLLLGNSAHTLHPIAAQGFNLALYEVATVVEKMKEISSKQQVISVEALKPIKATMEKQINASLSVSDRLPQVFANKGLLSLLRPIAMLSLDIAVPIKKHFINRMMGKIGSMPSLLLSTSE